MIDKVENFESFLNKQSKRIGIIVHQLKRRNSSLVIDDLKSESLLLTWRFFNEFEPEDVKKFEQWLKWRLIDYLRANSEYSRNYFKEHGPSQFCDIQIAIDTIPGDEGDFIRSFQERFDFESLLKRAALSDREDKVLQLIKIGNSLKDIALILNLSPSRITQIFHQIVKKLNPLILAKTPLYIDKEVLNHVGQEKVLF